jgi:hypothetical protein
MPGRRKEAMTAKRFRHVFIWEPGSAREPTSAFHEHPQGEWCRAGNVRVLEDRIEELEGKLRRKENPGVFRRAWRRMVG